MADGDRPARSQRQNPGAPDLWINKTVKTFRRYSHNFMVTVKYKTELTYKGREFSSYCLQRSIIVSGKRTHAVE